MNSARQPDADWCGFRVASPDLYHIVKKGSSKPDPHFPIVDPLRVDLSQA